MGENEQLEQRLTYRALREVSCWKVLDSILLIWLCCSPLLRNTYRHTMQNVQGNRMLILMHMCVQLCWGLNHSHLLQCRAVVKAGQILYLVVRQLPTTMHKAHTQSTHKHSDQLWIYSVGNYGVDRIIWVNSRLCEQGDIVGQ